MSPFNPDLLSSHLLLKNIRTEIYMTITLPVLYAYESWSLALRKNLGERVLQNMVSRDVFWPKHEEVTEDWRKLHNEDLHDLYFSPNIIWVIK
jgi:hypothetical protein